MYNVAPMFCPPSSWLHECYSSEFSYNVKVVVGPTQWGTCMRTIFHVTAMSNLACWNNNIATTGPTDCDIIILDALTGSQTAILSGHTNSINSLTYSSDGTYLVSGSSDRTIKFWDIQTGGVIKTLCGHTDQVYSVSISADNAMIASASMDETICLWNVKTGNCCIIEHHAIAVTFSPTNSQLLSSSSSGSVQQWDINGHKIGSPVPGDCVAFSPDGTQFISWKEETATIRNTDSKVTIVEFNLDNGAGCFCFSPNGKFIAVAVDHTIYLWDITSPNPYIVQTLIGHSSFVTSVVFSSPHSLISASCGESIKFWQIGGSLAGSVLSDSKTPSLTSAPIKAVSLQVRDGLAFSIDEAGVVMTWNILAGCYKEYYKTQIERIEHADLQLISDRLIIVWTEVLGQEINVWDAENGELQTIDIPDGYTQGLRMIGDGSRVLQLCGESIWAWNIWTGEFLCEERLKTDDVDFDTLRMDGSKVFIRFGGLFVQGWDFGITGSIPIQLPEISLGRPHLNLIDTSESLENGPVRIEDSITGEAVFQLYGKYARPSAIQWDGQYLIAGYESGDVLILDFGGILS
jgi:WD40 repeat protein